MLVFIFDQIYHLIYCAAGRFFLWDDFFNAHCINYPTIHALIRMWVHLPMMGGTVLSKQRNDNNRYNDMANLPLPATIAVKSILSYGLGAWSTLPICFCGYYVILTVVANSHFFLIGVFQWRITRGFCYSLQVSMDDDKNASSYLKHILYAKLEAYLESKSNQK